MPKWDVFLLGDLNVDLVLFVGKLPRPDTDIQVKDIRTLLGGVGYNMSAAMRDLGLNPYLVGSVGNDFLGMKLLEGLRNLMLDVSGVKVVSGVSTGLVVVLVLPDGSRALLSFRGANSHTALSTHDLTSLEDARHAHVSGYMLLNIDGGRAAIEVLRRAGELRISRSVDLEGIAFSNEERLKLIEGLAEHVFMNTEEMKSLTGLNDMVEGARRIRKLLKPETVVVKMGAEGSLALTDSEVLRERAPPVEAVDCTGAGDVFNAGFIYGTLKGLELRKVLRISNALAAYKCGRKGDRRLPAGPEILDALKDLWSDA
ncbi:MAG: carbohydrate kinase family protein [Zestosphaera sp.]